MGRLRAGLLPRALGLLLVLATAAPHAVAQGVRPETETETETQPAQALSAPPEVAADPYESLIDAGVTAFAAGHWGEARVLFERAHVLRPSARTLRALGMTDFNLHRYARAVAELEAAQQHPELPLDAALRAQAAELVQRAAPFVGRFALTLSPRDAQLRIDDAAPVRDPSGNVLLDIGHHQLVLEAPGHAATKQALDVQGGEARALALHALPLHAPTGDARAPRPGHRRVRVALMLASAGLALAAAGLGSWLRADRRFDAVAADCRAQGGCLPGTVDLSAIQRLERTAYGLGGAGGGLVLTGGVLGIFSERAARAEGAR